MSGGTFYFVLALAMLVHIEFPKMSFVNKATKIDAIGMYVKEIQPREVSLPAVELELTPERFHMAFQKPLTIVGAAKASVSSKFGFFTYKAVIHVLGGFNASKETLERACGDCACSNASLLTTSSSLSSPGCEAEGVHCDLRVQVTISQELTGISLPTQIFDLCPQLTSVLSNTLLEPPVDTPHPPLEISDSPMSHSRLFQAVENIAMEVNSLLGGKPSAVFVAPTAMQLQLRALHGTDISFSIHAPENGEEEDDDDETGTTRPPSMKDSAVWSVLRKYGLSALRAAQSFFHFDTIENTFNAIVQAIVDTLGLDVSPGAPSGEDNESDESGDDGAADEGSWLRILASIVARNTTARVATHVPAGASISFHLVTRGLRCSDDGYYCTVATQGGLQLANVRVSGLEELDTVFAHLASPLIENVCNGLINRLLRFFSSESDDQIAVLPMKRSHVRLVPHIAVVVVFPAFFFLLTAFFIGRNVRRHRLLPVCSASTGIPIHTLRIVMEDASLCGFTFATLLCYIWADTTTVATVTVGRVIEAYSFSLIETVSDLWDSGLRPLAVFVFAFSGIYPYVKLFCILLFTVILHSPNSKALHLIDYIGKISLLDTFVMLVMTAGLEIAGVADVSLLPPYYIFLAATVSSIALGNYACHYWRWETTTRMCSASVVSKQRQGCVCDIVERDELHRVDQQRQQGKEEEACCEEMDAVAAATAACAQVACKSEDGKQSPDRCRRCGGTLGFTSSTATESTYYATEMESQEDRGDSSVPFCAGGVFAWMKSVRWLLSIPLAALVLGLTLPSWICASLRYDAGGLASVATEQHAKYNLYELSLKAGVGCVVVTLATCVVAPVLYLLFFPRLRLLASWTAADALLLAIVAGLLQLNQFLQFVLGGNYDFFYNAHAHMLWPLIPFLLATVVVWMVVLVMDIFELPQRVIRRCARRQAVKEATSPYSDGKSSSPDANGRDSEVGITEPIFRH